MVQLLADFDTAHCGVIHDAQLDGYGQCLATASADGHVRLWDVRDPKEPSFLSDLGGHSGPVLQVVWAPSDLGVLLASCGSDGRVIVWGRCAKPGEWQQVHSESFERNGAVRAMAWAPAAHGIVLACGAADGTVTIVAHVGALRKGDVAVEHRWRCLAFKAHSELVNGVSWALPHDSFMAAQVAGQVPQGLQGARFVTAGSDGVCVWRCNDGIETLVAPTSEPVLTPPDLAKAAHRDVAWKAWDGMDDMIASATGQDVIIWQFATEAGWMIAACVSVQEEVWKVSWMEMGNILLLSCGEKEQRALLMKQQVSGEWDVMDASQIDV